ncbi:hypothetical protein K4F52_008655 [Lecanicillium sp. MT-2017a]|nr:hypothetical protein K4F52_008655 [Lecanicillium sp. MT-2017a]
MKLSNKVAIITGAKRGIGLAIAARFTAEESIVVLADIIDAEEEAAKLREGGRDAAFIQTDVTQEASVRALIEQVKQKYGRVDVLVNNAGIEFAKTIVDTSVEEWDGLMAVNAKGVFLCSKWAIPVMKEQGKGVIINVASELGLVGEANVAAYCASKGAVVVLTKAMAIDHGPQGIRVNCLCPGPVTTQLLEDVFASSDDPEGLRKKFEASTVLNRLGKPEEIANAAVFLASEDSAFMAGTNLVIDGGWTAR